MSEKPGMSTAEVAAMLSNMTPVDATTYVAQVARDWAVGDTKHATVVIDCINRMPPFEAFHAGCIAGIRFLARLIAKNAEDVDLAKIIAKIGEPPRTGSF